jgi:hypothetical protein
MIAVGGGARAHQGLEGGHDAKGHGGDDLLKLLQLSEEPQQPQRPEHSQLVISYI